MSNSPQPTTVPNQEAATLKADARYSNFTMVPNWLFDLRGISRDAKLTFALLLKYARQDSTCFPGMDKLTEALEATRQSVHNWIKELQVAGLVVVHRRGLARSNMYELKWPATLPEETQEPDVKQSLHQPGCKAEFTSGGKAGLTPDVKPSLPTDVKPATPYVYPVTKTQGTNTRGSGSDSENYGDASARNARAREAPPQQISSERTLDPQPDWVLVLAQRIYEHWGGPPAEGVPAEWCEVLWERLRERRPEERECFVRYLFSNDYLKGRSNERAVTTTLAQDFDAWQRAGCPPSKDRRPAPQSRPPAQPKVITYKPPAARITKDSPMEDILAMAAEIRQEFGPQSAPYANFLIGFELDREDIEQKLGAINGPASSF